DVVELTTRHRRTRRREAVHARPRVEDALRRRVAGAHRSKHPGPDGPGSLAVGSAHSGDPKKTGSPVLSFTRSVDSTNALRKSASTPWSTTAKATLPSFVRYRNRTSTSSRRPPRKTGMESTMPLGTFTCL